MTTVAARAAAPVPSTTRAPRIATGSACAKSVAEKRKTRTADLMTPLFEQAFGDHGVNALGLVDGLRHVEIHADAAQHVRIFARHVLLRDQEVDSFADRHLEGFVEIGV